MINRTIHNPALRGTITFLTTAKESHGAISELEVTVMPKGENPPHYHRSYDESFTVIEGMLRLHLGGGVGKDLGPGESYVVRAGNVHSFRNETNQPASCRERRASRTPYEFSPACQRTAFTTIAYRCHTVFSTLRFVFR
jgi:mannose-6-phosphate isomerase-like protein (cupin superfamily)